MIQKKHWITSLPKVIGLCAGIILTAVGSVMVLNMVLKVYILGFTEPRYEGNYETMCEYKNENEKRRMLNTLAQKNPEIAVVDTSLPMERSFAEKEACIAKEEAKAQKRYLREKKEDLVNGLSSLFVGIFFWTWFGYRRKKRD